MSRKIIVIGTLHAGLTNIEELTDVLDIIKPNQLLIEVLDKDIKTSSIIKYPPEMRFAIRYAKNKNLNCLGFDSKINDFIGKFSKKQSLILLNKQKRLLKSNSLTWIHLNQYRYNILLNEISASFTNKKLKIKREQEMLVNIKKKMLKNGIIVILTGTSHLNFFKNNIKNAIFPFAHKIVPRGTIMVKTVIFDKNA